MDHSMFHNRAESLLYRKLRPHLIGDLVSAGFPQSVAGSIVNYYDPKHSEYLQRVDAWQVLLCRGAVTTRDDLCPELVSSGIIRHTSFNSYSILGADPWMVYHVHTVIRLFYKFRGEPRSVQDFESVKSRLTSCPDIHLYTHELLGMRRILYENLIPPFSIHEMEFGFGPGASADVKGNYSKWLLEASYDISIDPEWYPLLHNDTLFNEKFAPRLRFHDSSCTKIAEVPKSLKSTRVVSSEPAWNMFHQLAVGRHLAKQLCESFPDNVFLHDQSKHNEALQRTDIATIDLSDASDHVSKQLVSILLPEWWNLLSTVRSKRARFRDGDEVELTTFAPMGSGVCFPTLTAVSVAILSYCCGSDWRAYGDDWIVPIRHYDAVLDLAARCGLVPNTRKSCCTGVYRESCGVEMFKSLNITSTYIRQDPAQFDSPMLEEVLTQLGRYDSFTATRGALVGMAKHALPTKRRWNTALQRWEVDVKKYKPVIDRRKLPDHLALNRWLSSARDKTSAAVLVYHSAEGIYKDSFCTKVHIKDQPSGKILFTRDSCDQVEQSTWNSGRLVGSFEPERDHPSLVHWFDTIPLTRVEG